MTEPTPPPRRPLATFLRATPGTATDPEIPAASESVDPTPDADAPGMDAQTPATGNADIPADDTQASADAPDVEPALTEPEPAAPPAPEPPVAAAPSFTRTPLAAPRTPRWQWGVVSALVVLLVLQIMVADRANLAADAGSRPWVAGLCSVLRCSLPAWHEPSAFSMISRDVRPVPTQPGALQVQASFRNDARWAQAWPQLRLSLSDADGRVIGTGVFAPQDYLGPNGDAHSVLEPGQSAQIAFRVREPAASTVAFTFEFL